MSNTTDTSNQSFFSKAVDLTAEPIKTPYLVVAATIMFAFILSPMLMAGLNAIDWTGATAIWTVVATTAILFVGLGPTNLVWSGIVGGVVAFFMDTDKSQGIATGPHWLWKLIIAVAFNHFMMGLVATVWDFDHVFGGFLAAWFVGVGFLLWSLYFNAKAKWYIRVTLTVLLLCLGHILWQSLNPGSVTGEGWFDNTTNAPLVMGYRNNQGEFVIDPEGRTPSGCKDGCFYKGQRLVTPTPADVPDTSGFGIRTPIDWFTTSPAEMRQAQNLRVRQNSTPSLPAQAIVRNGCSGPARSEMNCKTVTLGPGSTVAWVVDKSEDDRRRCVRYVPAFPFQDVYPGNGIVEYTNTSNSNTRTVAMYEVPIGTSDHTGNPC